jgi:apolipoprotein N-acyltransferase
VTRPQNHERAAVPSWWAAGLAVLGGLATWLAFPGPGIWPLAAVGVACLVLAVAGRHPRRAAGLGLLFGLAFFLPLLSWAGVYVGLVAWLPLAGLEAVYVAAVAAMVPLALRCPGGAVVRAVAVAGLWVAAEGLRARTPFGGFGWGRLAFSQTDAPTAHLAALGGAPLVSFAVALAGALLAMAILTAHGRRVALRRAGMATVAVAVVLAGFAVPLPVAAQSGTLDVAAVQGNVPEPGLAFNAHRRAVLDNHVRGTMQLAAEVAGGAEPRPDLVVWPENSSDIDPLRNSDARQVVDQAAQAIGVPILVGAVLQRDDGRLNNTTLVWEPGKGPVQRYDKRHPVPFGEYIPYRSFFRQITSAVDLVPRDFAAGDRVGLLDAAGTPLGTLICFEVVDDGLVADTISAGAQLLVVQTNNATFGFTDESVQQLAMSRLRAIEYGRAVVHISTVGVSGLIAPDGTVLRRSGLFTADVLQTSLPLRSALTPAARLGAAPEAALSALGLLGALAGAGSLARRRRRPAGSAAPETADAAMVATAEEVAHR